MAETPSRSARETGVASRPTRHWWNGPAAQPACWLRLSKTTRRSCAWKQSATPRRPRTTRRFRPRSRPPAARASTSAARPCASRSRAARKNRLRPRRSNRRARLVSSTHLPSRPRRHPLAPSKTRPLRRRSRCSSRRRLRARKAPPIGSPSTCRGKALWTPTRRGSSRCCGGGTRPRVRCCSDTVAVRLTKRMIMKGGKSCTTARGRRRDPASRRLVLERLVGLDVVFYRLLVCLDRFTQFKMLGAFSKRLVVDARRNQRPPLLGRDAEVVCHRGFELF
mmetsp:Transcript_18841/g.64868  ORF Transcript_18841/g.64868 Transcript_18841/m.64868 type:complete len:279 (-) Transcript_18841:700-1536(-)